MKAALVLECLGAPRTHLVSAIRKWSASMATTKLWTASGHVSTASCVRRSGPS